MAFATAIAYLLAGGVAAPAVAQNWWPFGGDDDRPPVPSEPVYRPDAVPQPPPGGQPGAGGPSAAQNWSTKNPICLQLEKRLVQENLKGSQQRSQLPQIEAEIREVDRTFNRNAQRLDSRCYEYFLFTKSFRSTRACRDLSRQVETDKRRLAELESRRQAILGSGERSFHDDIIRELARNNCGADYVEQARRQGGGGFWSDEDSQFGGTWTPRNAPIGATTYRTICVRTCDGFYFPISFATLPSHFETDSSACQSRCAAPAELYYYPNPGGTVNQSVAYTTQQPYTEQKFAFRYRKELIKGCSCKEDEFSANQSTPGRKADASQTGSLPGSLQGQGAPATTLDGLSGAAPSWGSTTIEGGN